jgi:hypothetical protein
VPEDAVPRDAVPEDAVPQDAVPQDAVPEDAVPQDAVPTRRIAPWDPVSGATTRNHRNARPATQVSPVHQRPRPHRPTQLDASPAPFPAYPIMKTALTITKGYAKIIK